MLSSLRLFITFALTTICACRTSTSCADVIATNLGPSESLGSGSIVVGIGHECAIPFIAPAGPTQFHLDAVSVAISTGTAGVSAPLTVRIAIDLNNLPAEPPAVPLVDMMSTTIDSCSGLVRLVSHSRPLLTAGQRYWIIAPQSTTTSMHWAYNNLGVEEGGLFRHSPQSSWMPGAFRLVPAFKVEGQRALGACCTDSGACALIGNVECTALGHTPQLPGTACPPTPCAFVFPTGACCRGSDNVCVIANSFGCLFTGGRFLGEGTACSPANGVNPCCAADFNNSGAVSTQDLFDFLAAFFAGCP